MNITSIMSQHETVDMLGLDHITIPAGMLASLNRSWQSKEGTYRALGMAGIEPTPSKSECDWTP